MPPVRPFRLTATVTGVALALAVSGVGTAAASHPGRNGVIALSSQDGSALTTVRPDGTDRQVLIDRGSVLSPDWSPDGRRLAYNTFSAEAGDNIIVVNADGSQARSITDGRGSPYRARNPVWSPDGRQIAFVEYYDSQLWVMNSDGSVPRQLTFQEYDGCCISAPSWSPDGASLAFGRFAYNAARDSYDTDLFAADARTGAVRQLAQDGFDPDYSPDGRSIVYVGRLAAADGSRLMMMNADGSNRRILAERPGTEENTPVWSPDGTTIAFISNRVGRADNALWLIDSDGSDQRRITRPSADDYGPAWQPLP